MTIVYEHQRVQKSREFFDHLCNYKFFKEDYDGDMKFVIVITLIYGLNTNKIIKIN
jgi:hypothetical protein